MKCSLSLSFLAPPALARDVVENAGSGKCPLMTAVNVNNSPAGSLNLK